MRLCYFLAFQTNLKSFYELFFLETLDTLSVAVVKINGNEGFHVPSTDVQ